MRRMRSPAHPAQVSRSSRQAEAAQAFAQTQEAHVRTNRQLGQAALLCIKRALMPGAAIPTALLALGSHAEAGRSV
jgi:hypothetical protein